MKKLTNYLANHSLIIAGLSFIEMFICFGFIITSIYNVAAFISLIFNFVVAFRLVCWRFGGDSSFIKDPLWDSLKRKGLAHQYGNICLDSAASALIFATVSFLIGIVLFFVFLIVL